MWRLLTHAALPGGFLANTAVAATARRLVGTVVAEIEQRPLGSFEPQGVSNTLWALAKMDWRSPVFGLVAAHLKTIALSSFNPQDISNTCVFPIACASCV